MPTMTTTYLPRYVQLVICSVTDRLSNATSEQLAVDLLKVSANKREGCGAETNNKKFKEILISANRFITKT